MKPLGDQSRSCRYLFSSTLHIIRSWVVLLLIPFIYVPLGICDAHCDELRSQFEKLTLNREPPSANEFGAWLISNHEYHCALEVSVRAIQSDASSWIPSFNAGRASAYLGKFDLASHYLESALRIAPQELLPRIELAQLQEKMNHPELAEQTYRAGVATLPEQPELLDGLAGLLAREHRYHSAISLWRRALVQRPGDTSFQLSIAVAYSDNGEQEDAEHTLQDCLKEHPTFEPALYTLGTAYARQGNFAQAVSAFQSALKLDPDDSVAKLSLAKMYMTLVQYNDAYSLLAEYVKTNESDVEALFMLGRCSEYRGNLDDAELYLKKAASLDSHSYDVQYNLGFTLLNKGRMEEAIDALKKAISLRPNLVDPHFQLSKAYRRAGQTTLADEQIAITEKIRAADANEIRSTVLGNQGTSALAMGNAAEAITNYEEALKLEPHNAKLYYDVSLAYRKQGDAAKELSCLKQAEANDPTLAIVHNQLGTHYMEANDYASAKDEFARALGAAPDSTDALNNLGVLLAREGNYKAAELYIRRALESNSSSVEAHLNLGLVLAAEGNLQGAVHAEKEALLLSPGNRSALSAMSQIEERLREKPASKQP